jgi:hypothetical protein
MMKTGGHKGGKVLGFTEIFFLTWGCNLNVQARVCEPPQKKATAKKRRGASYAKPRRGPCVKMLGIKDICDARGKMD